jgi:hypothetical protein
MWLDLAFAFAYFRGTLLCLFYLPQRRHDVSASLGYCIIFLHCHPHGFFSTRFFSESGEQTRNQTRSTTGYISGVGQTDVQTYCAPCHGPSGKGDGPAAAALKTPPADLTALPRTSGKFPAAKVTSILRGQGVPAQWQPRMPVWGPVFWQMSHGHETEVQQRIANLTPNT